MIKMPYDDIVHKIQEVSSLSRQDIDSRVQAKLSQLAGLISKEGAAHIIANELGVKLFPALTGKLEIKNILPGMRSVETLGRATQIFEERQFQTENRSGRVASFVLADVTGSIRVVCWGDQCDNFRRITPNAVVKIVGGYVRENSGRKEVHLNDKSSMVVNPADVSMPELPGITRKSIKELTASDAKVELLATIVQVFDPKFFEVCPKCSKRARPKDDKYECQTHGAVSPEYSYLVTCFVDDGTDNIRVTFFRDQALGLVEKKHEDFLGIRMNMESFIPVKGELMGRIIKIVGRVNKNEMFDRMEFVVDKVDPRPDPKAELEIMAKQPTSGQFAVEKISVNEEQID